METQRIIDDSRAFSFHLSAGRDVHPRSSQRAGRGSTSATVAGCWTLIASR